MDDAVRPPLADCHLQRVQHKFGPQISCHRPADDLAAPGLQNHCEIEKTARRRQEGDVGNPELVRPESSEIAVYQVRRRSGLLVPPCDNDSCPLRWCRSCRLAFPPSALPCVWQGGAFCTDYCLASNAPHPIEIWRLCSSRNREGRRYSGGRVGGAIPAPCKEARTGPRNLKQHLLLIKDRPKGTVVRRPEIRG